MENENENVPVEEQETAGETEAQATMGETVAAQATKPVKNELDVFISYSTKNKNVADAVVANFEQHGIRCWYAPRDILPGQEWVSAIKEALHKAKVFVLIYTDESNASRQVMNEVALAFNANKTIVPFRLTEGNMNDELEYYLTRVHWLDAVSKPLERNIEALRNYVETSLNRPASADPTKAAAAAPAAPAPKKEGKKKSKIGLWIGLAVAVIALIVGGIFAIPKLTGPKPEEYMEAGNQAFRYGNMGTEDLTTARENYGIAAEKGIVDAYYYLGSIETREYNYKAAKEYFEQGVEKDSNLCRLGLGYLYQKGYGVKADSEKAWKLYNEAKDNDCVEADFYLALIVKDGLAKQEPSGTKAAKYLNNVINESQDQRFVAMAYNQLGLLYKNGTADFAEDKATAIKTFEKITETMNNTDNRFLQEYNIGSTYQAMGEEVKAGDHFREAYDALEKMINAGSPYAILWSGVMKQYGYGFDRDYEEAIRLYQKANDTVKERYDHACCFDAMVYVGKIYANGWGNITRDLDKAFDYFKEAADEGYGVAAYEIGKLYDNSGYQGKGKEEDKENPNYDLARQWYDKATEYGCVDAYANIGYLYGTGKVTTEGNQSPDDIAMEWYQKGADLGSATCMYNMGAVYEKDKAYEKAFPCFEKAAYLEYANAQKALGVYYENGWGVTKDEKKAVEWYRKGAENNQSYCFEKVAQIYYFGQLSTEKNVDEAFAWAKKGAESGNAYCMYLVGCMYKNAEGTEKDLSTANAWFAKGAKAGNRFAMYEYASALENGSDGVEKNEEEANKWYLKSAELGYNNAMGKVADYYRKNNEDEKAFTWYKKLADTGYESKNLYKYLGQYYRQGKGTTKNEDEAFNWLVKAFDAGATLDKDDLRFLTFRYYPDDKESAFPYAKAGAEAEEPICMAVLGHLYSLGKGTEVNYQLALEWDGKAILSGKLSESNANICRNRIQGYVDNGHVTAEEAAKYLQ
ncbi:MAG: toll/interleukin-1 receptor domain-containing protein [Acetatifactor sp.]|nr:toll/interleukin-1 receptor domain-containing protein [Acetatifactor sp.]